ncbi:Gluconate transport-inducing protein [Mycoblastus sanguinarius]|nr:Gluconate transport-inducing protein [Mycoblastus sanguinarius]
MTTLRDLPPPSTASYILATAILCAAAGYFIGQASSLGLFSSAKTPNKKSKTSWPNSYDVTVHPDSSDEELMSHLKGGKEVPDSEEGVSVSRVGTPEANDRTPTMVFYDDTLLESFKLVAGETSGLLVLLLLTLTELCHQLFLGQVDEAQLKPKLVKLLRRAFR